MYGYYYIYHSRFLFNPCLFFYDFLSFRAREITNTVTHKTKFSMKKRAIKRENSWIRDIWLFAQASGSFTHPPPGPTHSQGCPQFWRFEKERMERDPFTQTGFLSCFPSGSSNARSAGREAASQKISVILLSRGEGP